MDMDRMREMVLAASFASEMTALLTCGERIGEKAGDVAYATACRVADAFVAAAGRAGKRESGT